MYTVCANVNDISVVEVPLLDASAEFQLDLKTMRKQIMAHPEIKVAFLCSPGNPTARQLKRADVAEILSWPEYTGMVVLDEAYVDFCEPCNLTMATPSMVSDDKKGGGEGGGMGGVAEERKESGHGGCWGSAVGASDGSRPFSLSSKGAGSRLIVTQTLSKAWGMAGIRCGLAFANDEVIDLFNRVKAPYNVNVITSLFACVAVGGASRLQDSHPKLSLLIDGRRRAINALQTFPGVEEVYPSDANFIIFRLVPDIDAKQLHAEMARDGVVCRYRGNCLHLRNCLRLTIGTEEETDTFLSTLKKRLADKLSRS